MVPRLRGTRPVARGCQDAGITQPRDNSLAYPCICTILSCGWGQGQGQVWPVGGAYMRLTYACAGGRRDMFTKKRVQPQQSAETLSKIHSCFTEATTSLAWRPSTSRNIRAPRRGMSTLRPPSLTDWTRQRGGQRPKGSWPK